MPTKPVHKTPAEQLAERAQALGHFQQQNEAHRADLAAQQAKRDAFVRQVEQFHADRAVAIARGEEPPPVKPTTLTEAFAQRSVDLAVEKRLRVREIASSPEHQRFVDSLPQPPGRHREWVKAHINDNVEMSPVEAWAQFQDAKQGVDRANKQLAAVKGRILSPEELAYAEHQVEVAKAAEAATLALFNELTDVPVPAPEPIRGIKNAVKIFAHQGG